MATLRDLYQRVVNMEHEERVNLAAGSGAEVLKYLEERGFDGQKRFEFILYLTGLFAGADGELGYEEWKLFKDVTGSEIDHAQFKEALAGLDNPEFVESIDKVIDSFPDEVKAACCYYGLAFVAADDTITAREQAIFERILA